MTQTYYNVITLPTEKSNVLKDSLTGKFYLTDGLVFVSACENKIPQLCYQLSKPMNETGFHDMVVGDWVYDQHNKKVVKLEANAFCASFSKIIYTNDPSLGLPLMKTVYLTKIFATSKYDIWLDWSYDNDSFFSEFEIKLFEAYDAAADDDNRDKIKNTWPELFTTN